MSSPHWPQAGLLAPRAHGGPRFTLTPSATEKELTPEHGHGVGAPVTLAITLLPDCSHPGARQAGRRPHLVARALQGGRLRV